MAVPHHERERVEPRSREEWRAWLAGHHATSAGVWLVSWKKRTGRQALSYDEQVEEALCVGWVDSTARPLDDDRSMLWFAPRRRGSPWAGSNKERVARLEREGLMTEAGRRAIAAAQRDGSWSVLDGPEALVVPDDLAAALAAAPGARARWDALRPSVRRQHLAGIALARRDETRRRRVAAAVEQVAATDGPEL